MNHKAEQLDDNGLMHEVDASGRQFIDAQKGRGGMSEWRPIETAPKVRDLILSDGVTVCHGGWISQIAQGAEYEGQAGAPSPYWWSVHGIDPTHWMPLPDPPQGA